MGIEIERKFLLRNDNWQAEADAGTRMRQGYFAGPQRASIRVRIEGESANLNIKSAELGIRRLEFEYPVPLAEAEEMLDSLCEKPLVEKTRYHVRYAGAEWEVDVFEGDNAGLVVAEIELPGEEAGFEKPEWLGDEVSDDPRYYNVSLVTHPYCDW
jgi:adenylate cyclase